MQISMSKTREQFPLSRRKLWKKVVLDCFGVSLMLIITNFCVLMLFIILRNEGFYFSWFLSATLVIWLFIISKVIWSYIYQLWYFAKYFYDLTPDFIIIRKGIWTPKEITIPYERVQDVYVDQDIYDRIFGLYDVHLASATYSSGAQAHIDGLERLAMEGLRDLLLQTIRQKVNKISAGFQPPAAV